MPKMIVQTSRRTSSMWVDTYRSKEMDMEEVEVQLAAKLVKEREFMEQTAKAIEHYEQNRDEGPHVAHMLELLHMSYEDSQRIISGIEAPEFSSDLTLPPTNEKYGKPYMEK